MRPAQENQPFHSASSSEQELVAALKRKERKALEYLYDHYSDALYGVIFQIIQNDPLAEDALQESFLKIWKKIESYDQSKGRLFTWLLRISRNTAIDLLRSKHQKVAKFTLDSPLSKTEKVQTESIPTDLIGLGDLLLHMKQEQRILMEYIYFKGYSQSETAKHLNIPLGTVKTRTRLALNYLRSIVKQEKI
ncbi:MAG: sigma-70 family RNA polymerase sigma factor [Bacteroidia bacterium]|nr:sigma-70 family RNA polymerase sigma factor [Bacteroidia bacterium]